MVLLLHAYGRETSVAYISQIEGGHRRPSYDLAKDLSAITGGRVSAVALLEFTGKKTRWRPPSEGADPGVVEKAPEGDGESEGGDDDTKAAAEEP